MAEYKIDYEVDEDLYDDAYTSSSSDSDSDSSSDDDDDVSTCNMNGPVSTTAHENKRQKKSPAKKRGKKATTARGTRCPRGQIMRRGYTRTTSSGKRVRVPATCVPDKGLKGRGPRLLPPVRKPGWLGSFGYAVNYKAGVRRAALAKAIKSEGSAVAVLRRLVFIRNYQHRTNPKVAAKLERDYKWIQKTYRTNAASRR